MRPRALLAFGVILAALAPFGARAASCPVPFTFTNGTPADATQVNANFVALQACIAAGGGGAPPGGGLYSTQYNLNTMFGGSGPGLAGQVLTSNGPSLPPSFQAPGAASVSITGGDSSIVASPSPITGTGTITVGGPSHLTAFPAGTLPMGAGASPFTASEITDVGLSGVVVGSPTGGAKGAGTINMTGCFINNVACASGGSTAFSAITGGTNASAAMVVGTGASLAVSGSGTIAATSAPLSGLTGLGTGVATALGDNVGSAGAFVVNGGALGTPSSGALTNATGLPTAGLLNSAVTYAKLQNETASTLLGNPTGSAAAPSEITLGTNLSFSGSVLNAAGGGGTPVFFAGPTTAGSANTYTQAATTPSGFALTNGYVVRTAINATNTAASTLNVNSTGATSVEKQLASGLAALSGGELNANHVYDFTYNSTCTCFVVINTDGSAVVSGFASATISQPQWANVTVISVTTASQTITLPSATTLAANGGIFVQAIGNSATLTPQSGDAINGGALGASVTLASGGTYLVTTSSTAGATAFSESGGGGGSSGANPTATAGPSAINGSATTFMRSDAAPAVQAGSASQEGILQCGSGTTCSAGTISVSGGSVSLTSAGTGLTLSPSTITGTGTLGLTNVSSTPHEWFNSVVSNALVATQPAFTDISGSVGSGQYSNTLSGGFTSSPGTENTGSQTLVNSSTLSGQDWTTLETSNTTVNSATQAGHTLVANGSGSIQFTFPNPTTEGLSMPVLQDKSGHGFTITTTSGTATFYGFPNAGGTTVTVPPYGAAQCTDDITNSAYRCVIVAVGVPQFFTATGSSTFTNPPNAAADDVVCIGAGGGGGSGAAEPSGTSAISGSSGGGGSANHGVFPASVVGATATVFNGTGGAGGAAVASPNQGLSGSDGSANTTFTSASSVVLLTGYHAGGAVVASTSSASGGASGQQCGAGTGTTGGTSCGSISNGAAGASSTNGNAPGNNGTTSPLAGPSGGTGGGLGSGGGVNPGGNGGFDPAEPTAPTGGAGGTTSGSNGSASVPFPAGMIWGIGPGSAPGGGGSCTTTACTAGSGGTNTTPGAGGAGGGASTGGTSGAGSAGGNGACTVTPL